MSINVTIHGNPISIKRGKMVAIDADKEFERRRKIRLQQVRQQSKEIAEEVRNKVRKEKSKQFGKLEKNSEKDLKQFQENKLSSLQKQYQNCLEEFGNAYKDAETQPDDYEIIQKVTEIDRKQAELRGQYATEKLKGEKEEQEKGTKKQIDDKKHARNIENLRSKLVTSLQRNKYKQSPFKIKRKKKLGTEIRINGIPQQIITDDSDENGDSEFVNLSVLNETTDSCTRSSCTNLTLESEGNSTFCQNSPQKERSEENDIDIICDGNQSDIQEIEVNITSPTNSRLQRTKISFKETKEIGSGNEDDYQDLNSYRSHRTRQKKNGRIKDMYSQCQPCKDEIDRIDSLDPIKHKSSYIVDRLNPSGREFKEKSQQMSLDFMGDHDITNQPEYKTRKSSISNRSKFKEYEPEDEFKDVNKLYNGSSRFSRDDDLDDNADDDLMKQYRERLQSGTDAETLKMYLGKFGICDESNCPAVRSMPARLKPEIRSLKTPRMVKSSKCKRNANSKTSAFRKTIRSIKSTSPLKDGVGESEVVMHVHDYDLSEDGLKRLSPNKICTNKKLTPSKLRYVSPTKICSCGTESGLPFVPTTTVRPETAETQDTAVKYYDHFNHFNKDSHHPTMVQKISKESIQVCPPSDEEMQYRDMMIRRDAEATRRGMRALEKNKIHRDYQQLMEALPVLQRQERLASMATHNPAHHMSDERYQDLERKKQNRMENLYENYEMKSKSFDIPLITIKSIRKSAPSREMKQPCDTLDVSENSTTVLNVGQWEAVDSTTNTCQTTTEESHVNDSENKEQTLANLLRRVNKQREILIKEAANLPSLQSLKHILNEEELLNLLCKCTDTFKDTRPRVLVETGTSPLVTKESSTFKKPKKGKSCSSKTSSKTNSKRNATTSSSDTSIEIPPQNTKKGKSRKKFKILIKEEATQTSPFISKSVPTVCKKVEEKMKEEGTQTSLCCPNAGESSCFCSKNECQQVAKDTPDLKTRQLVNNSTSTSDSRCDKVCEIIIKAGEDSNVQISQLSPSRTLNPKSSRSRTSDCLRKESPKKSSVFIKIKETQDKRGAIPKNMMEISTSTSYMSPPAEISKKSDSIKPSNSFWKQPSQRPSNKELLQPQRQQTNIDHLVKEDNGAKQVNPRLVKYITKLLNMSRQSIDELTISSVSDVSTPTDSIIHTATNIARDKLQSVMDHFNLSVDDIKKYYLSTSTLSTSDFSIENVQLHKNIHDKINYDSSTDAKNYKICKEKSHAIPKQFNSVSTSTDAEETKIPKSTKSTITSTTLGNEIYEPIKQEDCVCPSTSTGYQRTQSKSSKRSPTPSCSRETKKQLNSSTGVDASTASDPEQLVGVHSQTPKHMSSGSTMVEKATYVREAHEMNPTLHSSASYTIDQEKRYVQYIASNSNERQRSPKAKSPDSSYSATVQRPQSPRSVTTKTVSAKQLCSPSCSPKREHGKVAIHSDSDSFSNEEAVWRKPEKFLQFVRESLGMSVAEFSELGFQDMFSRHMELTEYCHDRIKSLMALIEKVRNDKRQIYTPSPIDQSMTLTSYLELPQSKPEDISEYNGNTKKPMEEELSGGSSSISQGTLDDYLLGIEKNELAQRKDKSKKQVTYQDEVATSNNEGILNSKDVQETFVPMLQGIPKYCEVDSAAQQSTKNLLTQIFQQVKAKPPPSLLRANMRGHTDVTPHELSTIAEGETIVSSMSTSLYPAQSPEEKMPSRDISPCRQYIPGSRVEMYSGDDQKATTNMQTQTLEVKFVSPVESEKSTVTSESGDYLTISPEKTVNIDKELRADMNAAVATNSANLNTSGSSIRKSSISGVRPLSDSTTESPDELEAMLRKFKLEWAIALVRKTEQALALSSSSSASDLVQSGVKQDNSDVSVREAYQQIYHKIASSSGSDIEKSQIFLDLSQHFRQFHDISEIAGVAESRNKSQQRTSTPVQHSKSTESKNSASKDSLFKGDSELSSVRNSSDDHMFLSIPNITLNTTKCSLNKSKK